MTATARRRTWMIALVVVAILALLYGFAWPGCSWAPPKRAWIP